MTLSRDAADRPARVLIVDDEATNRQLLEVLLGSEGLRFLSAAGGEDALAIVAAQPPDLILLDIMMPRMDGYQVATLIMANPATRHIPIVMVTGLDDRDVRMLVLNAGADDFLTKPVDRAELCMRVNNLLRLKAYGDYHANHKQLLDAEVGSEAHQAITTRLAGPHGKDLRDIIDAAHRIAAKYAQAGLA